LLLNDSVNIRFKKYFTNSKNPSSYVNSNQDFWGELKVHENKKEPTKIYILANISINQLGIA